VRLTEVGPEVGFSSLSAFATAFHKATGFSIHVLDAGLGTGHLRLRLCERDAVIAIVNAHQRQMSDPPVALSSGGQSCH
jgi:AraC-like DNA-binding protein